MKKYKLQKTYVNDGITIFGKKYIFQKNNGQTYIYIEGQEDVIVKKINYELDFFSYYREGENFYKEYLFFYEKDGILNKIQFGGYDVMPSWIDNELDMGVGVIKDFIDEEGNENIYKNIEKINNCNEMVQVDEDGFLYNCLDFSKDEKTPEKTEETKEKPKIEEAGSGKTEIKDYEKTFNDLDSKKFDFKYKEYNFGESKILLVDNTEFNNYVANKLNEFTNFFYIGIFFLFTIISFYFIKNLLGK